MRQSQYQSRARIDSGASGARSATGSLESDLQRKNGIEHVVPLVEQVGRG